MPRRPRTNPVIVLDLPVTLKMPVSPLQTVVQTTRATVISSSIMELVNPRQSAHQEESLAILGVNVSSAMAIRRRLGQNAVVRFGSECAQQLILLR